MASSELFQNPYESTRLLSRISYRDDLKKKKKNENAAAGQPAIRYYRSVWILTRILRMNTELPLQYTIVCPSGLEPSTNGKPLVVRGKEANTASAKNDK